MSGPVIAISVPIDGQVYKGECVYHGAKLVGGASASSTANLYDGSSTSGARRDRLVAGIAEVKDTWTERGVICWSGIYADVDGNQTDLVVFYSLPEDEQ